LVISIPLTNITAIGTAAKRGILLKRSNFLAALARVRTLVYDKTGTLTTGQFVVEDIVPLAGVQEQELLTAALTCTSNSTHPLALAITNTYNKQVRPYQALLVNEFSGRGIQAETSEGVLFAGNREFLINMGVVNVPEEPQETSIFVGKNHECLGYITFRDEIKEGFGDVIKRLKRLGIRRHIMLTGDHAHQAEIVATALRLNSFTAKLLPQEKLEHLQFITDRNQNPVAFVGDGLNDAPVIAQAAIGIAMGADGNQSVLETADVVLMNSKPQQLLEAVQIARQTQHILWQNVSLIMGIKLCVMLLGSVGLANLWEAVIADVGTTMLSIANALRLLRFRDRG